MKILNYYKNYKKIFNYCKDYKVFLLFLTSFFYFLTFFFKTNLVFGGKCYSKTNLNSKSSSKFYYQIVQKKNSFEELTEEKLKEKDILEKEIEFLKNEIISLTKEQNTIEKELKILKEKTIFLEIKIKKAISQRNKYLFQRDMSDLLNKINNYETKMTNIITKKTELEIKLKNISKE